MGKSGYCVANTYDRYLVCNGGGDRVRGSIGEKSLALFENATASLFATSAPQDGAQSTPTIQSTADAQALPPTAREAPTGAEIAAALGIPERQVGVVVQRVREIGRASCRERV